MSPQITPVAALAVILTVSSLAGERADIVVDKKGEGHFTSIQEALRSIEHDDTPALILIRNGEYREKVFITRSHVSLVGENQDSTRIVYAELRAEWNKEHGGSDWGAGVVNIDTGVTDITLANLTVYNNYGWKYRVFNEHQFAVRGAGTRIMLLYCTVVSDGGDALSLWNRKDGMYYHADCRFEGWVDFVCPRGWCYVTRSAFFGHNRPSASIWHDGSNNRNQKFVIVDSYFDGVPGFPLGRNHLDAQIYLVRCRFTRNMADRPFYRPPSSPRAWQWGSRHYFYDCHRDGGDYAWFADNLNSAEGSPNPKDITARWTFDGMWDPEENMPAVLPFAFLPKPQRDARDIPVQGVVLTWVPGRNAVRHNVYFGTGRDLVLVKTQNTCVYDTGVLKPNKTYYWRVDEVTPDGVVPGKLWSFSTQGEPGE